MSAQKKRTRLLTNRNFSDGKSWEAIELDALGTFFWIAEDEDMQCGASFPVDLEFVRDKFREMGRELDESRLPPHSKLCPYTGRPAGWTNAPVPVSPRPLPAWARP
jgi:hypothetical protein